MTFKVVTTDPARPRTLFDGPEAAARQFVQNNFPRPHVEPPGLGPNDKPIPDVVLVSESGNKEFWHAEDGWAPYSKDGSALA